PYQSWNHRQQGLSGLRVGLASHAPDQIFCRLERVVPLRAITALLQANKEEYIAPGRIQDLTNTCRYAAAGGETSQSFAYLLTGCLGSSLAVFRIDDVRLENESPLALPLHEEYEVSKHVIEY